MTTIKIYEAKDGKRPFEEWHSALPVQQALKIDDAVTRMELGNFGDHKTVGGGVMERRIHTSPAMRVYYAMDGKDVVILLAGGTKHRQERDIARAKDFWAEYNSRK
jgi:putative addiction module killer protein